MKDKLKLLISITIPLLVGGLSALISNISTNFDSFKKPVFTPPGIVFPIVWTVLYILMGISSYIIYKNDSLNKKDSLIIYKIQLLINGIWSIVFFKLKLFLLAFILVLVLLVLTYLMIVKFKSLNKLAGYLQIPYFIWLLFAAILSASVYLLN